MRRRFILSPLTRLINQFIKMFRVGIPKIIRFIQRRLRLKLIAFFVISMAAALILGSIASWISWQVNYNRNYTLHLRSENPFETTIYILASELNNGQLDVTDVQAIERRINAQLKYASEKYYLVKPDGTVVAKSQGAPGNKIDVFSLLQKRLSGIRSELILENLPRIEQGETNPTEEPGTENQPGENPEQSKNPFTSQPELQSQPGANSSRDTNQTPENRQSVVVTPPEMVPDPSGEVPIAQYARIEPVNIKGFTGYIVGFIDVSQYRAESPPYVQTQAKDYSVLNGLIVGIGTFFVVFFHLTRNTLATIENIAQNVRKITKGDFAVRVKKQTDDELGELTEDINIMVQELEQSIEKERQAQQTKAELITNASHDLRTPLTSMIGYMELLRNDHRSEQEKARFFDIAYAKTLRLKGLVDDLFEYTKSSSNDLRLDLQRIDLCEFFGQLLTEFEPELERSGMNYELHCEGQVTAEVDPEKMLRVFENLISNAIRYGAEGKKISVQVDKGGDIITVKVTNYGAPIAEGDLPNIFERFYRVEKSRSEKTGGSGLGLAIAKNLVERHGGTINVSSDSQCTTFTVSIRV